MTTVSTDIASSAASVTVGMPRAKDVGVEHDIPLATRVDRVIARYQNWPIAGVDFADLSGVYARPEIFKDVVRHFDQATRSLGATHIVAMDARGFILGAALALSLEVPFVLARKKGKLPGACLEVSYSLEYGSASMEIQLDAVEPGDRVLLVDDILATGGTLLAASELIQTAGATIAGVVVLGVVEALGGEAKLGAPVLSLVQL